MQASIGSVSTIGVAAMLFAMFVILLVCVHRAIKEMSFFGESAGWVVTVCVALLSIVGLVRFFGSTEAAASLGGEPREAGGLLDVVLLPYVALALTILLVLLLVAAGRVLHGREPWHPQEPARSRRTSTERGLREGDNHPKTIRIYKPWDGKQLRSPSNRDLMGDSKAK